MNFLKKVLTFFVAVLLTLFALSVVIKHNPSDSGKESVSESEQYSESKTAEVKPVLQKNPKKVLRKNRNRFPLRPKAEQNRRRKLKRLS